MSDLTVPQLLALGELVQGSCWPARSTEPGWVQAKAAASLVDLGLASRTFYGRSGVESGTGKIGGQQYLYKVTEAGRVALLAAVDTKSDLFAVAGLACLRDGRHARRSLRLGDSAELRCACGWPGRDEDGLDVRGKSGADTSRLVLAAYRRHVDEVVAAAVLRSTHGRQA